MPWEATTIDDPVESHPGVTQTPVDEHTPAPNRGLQPQAHRVGMPGPSGIVVLVVTVNRFGHAAR